MTDLEVSVAKITRRRHGTMGLTATVEFRVQVGTGDVIQICLGWPFVPGYSDEAAVEATWGYLQAVLPQLASAKPTMDDYLVKDAF